MYETYTYDTNGNPTTKTDRNGSITTNVYDNLNRLTSVTVKKLGGAAAAEFMTYAYAKTGAKTQEKNENLTVDYVYDDMGRLIKQTESNGVVKTYGYDLHNNRTSFSLVRNGAAVLSQTYEYDGMNRLTKTYEAGALAATYTYDKNGNRESLSYPNGVVTSYAYNSANLVTNLTNKNSSVIISGYAYTYYLDGNQASKTENTGRATTYTYDKSGRLTKETETSSTGNITKAYAYDAAGNRKTLTVSGKENYTVTYTYDLNNRLLKESKDMSNETTTTEYRYDNNGNQTSKLSYVLSPQTAKPASVGIALLGEGDTRHTAEICEYDVFNRLVRVLTGSSTALYTYKADGLRLSKTVNGAKTTHVWDGGNIVLEFDAGNAVTGKYTRGINLIKSNAGYYVYNAHGDVVQIVNSAGAVIKEYDYDAYGVSGTSEYLTEDDFRSFDRGAAKVTVYSASAGKTVQALQLPKNANVPVMSTGYMGLKQNKTYILEFEYWSD